MGRDWKGANMLIRAPLVLVSDYHGFIEIYVCKPSGNFPQCNVVSLTKYRLFSVSALCRRHQLRLRLRSQWTSSQVSNLMLTSLKLERSASWGNVVKIYIYVVDNIDYVDNFHWSSFPCV